MRLRDRLARRLLNWAEGRDPDFVIGGEVSKAGPDGDDRNAVLDPERAYLRRWWVIRRNPIFNIYLHQILRSDDDRALHDHPWVNCSVLLRGRYVEVLPWRGGQAIADDFLPANGGVRRVMRLAGDVVVRRARSAHRLEIVDGPCWTLFITGPRLRAWGFRCPRGWRHWLEFTSADDRGAVGRGCD